MKAYSEKWHRTLKDSMRSTLYDTVSDRYVRFLRDEILADVAAKYNIRKDAYSHAITGLSSGRNLFVQCGVANARSVQPGDFVDRQLYQYPVEGRSDVPDGGQDYPENSARTKAQHSRVAAGWFAGSGNRNYGSWPLANIRMANALKLKDTTFISVSARARTTPGR